MLPDLPTLVVITALSASAPATGLPLIVAITTLGVAAGQMRLSTASALVGAGMVSVLVFPLAAAALRRPDAS